MRFVWGLAIAISIAAIAPARADDSKPTYRTVIDRADLERASIGGQRLRVYVSGLALQGQVIDLSDPKSLKLVVGGSEKKVPYTLGAYNSTTADTAIVLCIQASATFADVLRQISDAIDTTLLADLNDHTQIAIMMYGDALASGKLASAKATRAKLSVVTTDNSASEPILLDTLDRALGILKKVKVDPEGRPIRKMVVVIGDGRDLANDRERVTKTGLRALKEGVHIHSLAFSPNDARRTLLVLGELSKQSQGTFRWIRGKSAESWTQAFSQLHDEIAKQYVITFYFDNDEDLAGKKIKIQTLGRIETTSNEVKIPTLSCAGEACEAGYCADDHCQVPAAATGRGVFGWLLVIIGIGIGALAVLWVIGYVMSRRQKRPGMPGVVPGAPGVAPGAPGVAPGMPGVAPGMRGVVPTGMMPPGQVLPQAPPLGAQPITGPIVGPTLLVLTGPRAGERFALRHGFMVGKAPGCDLVIDDGFTSSQHAQFAMDDKGNCRLYDKGSTNGTFVNGVRIGEFGLSHGVGVRIGSTELRFLAE